MKKRRRAVVIREDGGWGSMGKQRIEGEMPLPMEMQRLHGYFSQRYGLEAPGNEDVR